MFNRHQRFDRWWIGIITGVLAPVGGFFIFYLLNYSYMSVNAFVRFIISGNVYTQVMSLCVIANLPLFFGFLRFNLYRSARGVVLTTLLYAIANFILKTL